MNRLVSRLLGRLLILFHAAAAASWGPSDDPGLGILRRCIGGVQGLHCCMVCLLLAATC